MGRERRNRPGFVAAPTREPRSELVDLTQSERLTDVVRAAQSGEPAAIHALVTDLSPPLLQAVRALMGPAHPDVEDLLQEVLIAVIDALPSFRGESTLLHFAIRIATRRTTAARRRTRSILGWLEQFWRSERPLVAQPTSPHRDTLADRRRSMLRTLLGELPEAQAEAMVLRLALGYTVEEIATITSAPINTVRSRLRLAKDALRNRIEADPRWSELWGNEP